MKSKRFSLLGGPVFFVLWFIGAQMLFFASGGSVNGQTVPTSETYPTEVLSNEAGVNGGATLLVLAAISLTLFASGVGEKKGLSGGLFPVLAIWGVAVLLILQAGLTVGSLLVAAEAPSTAWHLHEASEVLGFESFITSLLGGAALTNLAVAGRSTVSQWFWWATVVFAGVLTVGGLLEGFGVTPPGRFAILFGLWAFVAGFASQTGAEPSN